MVELSDKVNEVSKEMEIKKKKTGSTIRNLSLAGGATWLSYAAVGFGGPLTGLGFAAGSAILNLFKKVKDEKSKGLLGILRSYTTGTILGMVGVPMYDAAAKYIANPVVRGVLGGTVGNAVWSGAYIGVDHTIKHGTKGIKEAYKEKFGPLTQSSMLFLGLPVGMTINGYWGGYPGIVGIDAGFSVLGGLSGKKKEEKATDKYQIPSQETPINDKYQIPSPEKALHNNYQPPNQAYKQAA